MKKLAQLFVYGMAVALLTSCSASSPNPISSSAEPGALYSPTSTIRQNTFSGTPTAVSQVPVSSPTASASTTIDTLKTYKDSYSGVSIQYPSNGKIVTIKSDSEGRLISISNVDVEQLKAQANISSNANLLQNIDYVIDVQTIKVRPLATPTPLSTDTTIPPVSSSEPRGLGLGVLSAPEELSYPPDFFSPESPQCNGNVLTTEKVRIDNIPGYAFTWPSSYLPAGLINKSYCFRTIGKESEVQYVDVYVSISEKSDKQKLISQLSKTISFK